MDALKLCFAYLLIHLLEQLLVGRMKLDEYGIVSWGGLFSRYYFLEIIIQQPMKKLLVITLLLGLLFITQTTDVFYADYRHAVTHKKGLTFTATIYPEQTNSFVGRMSCNGCNPQQGDTPCTEKLPVLCIIHHKLLHRPYYNYYPDNTPYDNPDQSYYEGWTGGIFAMTDPVRGLEIDSYRTGDNMCKTAYGDHAKFATFTDGYHMKYMNGPDLKIEKAWDWGQASSGEYNMWGIFNHDHIGRSWIWTQYTPNGNCMLPNSGSV